jgi:GNAT superfamily N-acetyltransferase
MTVVHVRPATPDDVVTIADFNAQMALETEGRTLDELTLRQGVAAVLADAQKGRYFVAERGLAVAGCLLLTFEWSDWRNGTFWWIQSVYVEPSHRERGVFRALHAFVRDRALAMPGVVGLRLYVDHGNERAKRVYQVLGMASAGYEVLEEDFVLAKPSAP